MGNIIQVTGLKKNFTVHQKEKEGFLYALLSLFKRKYITVSAVKSIDLEIKKGEIRGLIGPNGAGKSTTIKILSGILYPTAGDVKVMGYTPWLEREQYVKKIGVVFGQKGQLVWDLPAIDTFLINKEMYKIPVKKFKENLEYFKELLHIGHVIQKPVRQLSLGEKMKCELVCALLHEPPLVYLDEPTIGLDILSKEAIRKFIKEVNQEKETTFIITTHDLGDIENLCKKITIINHGSIVYDGLLANLKSRFEQKKILDLQFSQQISKDSLSDYPVMKFDALSASIEIDLSQMEIQRELYKIFQTLPVQDINMHDIDIETLIKQIYVQPEHIA